MLWSGAKGAIKEDKTLDRSVYKRKKMGVKEIKK